MVNIHKNFSIGYKGSTLVTTDNDITLTSGTHYLLGKNGMGKTTLLRTLADLLPPTKGDFSYKGRKLFLPEDLQFDKELNAKAIITSLIPKSRHREALEVASKIELNTKLPYGKLSTGNKRKILLILSEYQLEKESPSFIMMDEPLSGLDQEVREFIQARWNTKDENKSRLISYHPDNENATLTSVLIITKGKLKHITGKSLDWSQLRKMIK